jgi:hypothetical protein
MSARLTWPSAIPAPSPASSSRQKPLILRASVGSTGAAKDVVARVGIVGPTRATTTARSMGNGSQGVRLLAYHGALSSASSVELAFGNKNSLWDSNA